MESLHIEYFDGFCPECKLFGKYVKMRLNRNDFFESEETGLQIAVPWPGVMAVVLRSRGEKKYKANVSFAHETANSELLALQDIEGFPYSNKNFIEKESQLSEFLLTNMQTTETTDLGKLLEFVRNRPDFKFLKASNSYYLPVGSSYEFDNKKEGITYQNMGAIILDSILQAGLNYETVVRPRIVKYLDKYHSLKTTSDFAKLISDNGVTEITSLNGVKNQRVLDLTELFLKERIENHTQLKKWLENESNLLKLNRIKGVKSKTIDYLKILAGFKDSIAVDRRLIAFLNKAGIEVTINDYNYAKSLLSAAAQELNIDATDFDFSIWSYKL